MTAGCLFCRVDWTTETLVDLEMVAVVVPSPGEESLALAFAPSPLGHSFRLCAFGYYQLHSKALRWKYAGEDLQSTSMQAAKSCLG